MKMIFCINENPNKWKESELDSFFLFCERNKEQLTQNFFNNLKQKKKTIKKPQNFFLKLSKAVKTKTKSQCKSKYQKLEKFILNQLLDISLDKYEELQILRKQKPISNAKIKKKKNK